MIEAAPEWKKALASKKPDELANLLGSEEIRLLIKKANSEYLHWDRFRYQPLPSNISAEVAWALLKITRMGSQEYLPIADENQKPFTFSLTKEHQRDLSYIDSKSSGVIASSDGVPNSQQTDQLVINGLIEEAISSSQIEGASTTRKAAKAMIEQMRTPKNKSERMVLNNYMAMMRLEEWKSRKLDEGFLLELHKVLTSGTLDRPSEEGCFRSDDDEIVIADTLTGETIHTPPKMKNVFKQLEELYNFANTDSEDENYIHPFVKASILHFLLGYIHPFTDGNGRSARALFYWYLLKEDYWMFKYLPISLQIKKKEWRQGYYRAFEYVETDAGDITYFLSYKLKLAKNAIKDFHKYLEKKQTHATQLKESLIASNEINPRQIEVIEFLQRNPGYQLDLKTHKSKHNIAYETARTDLLELSKRRILKQLQKGNKYIFTRGESFPSKK